MHPVSFVRRIVRRSPCTFAAIILVSIVNVVIICQCLSRDLNDLFSSPFTHDDLRSLDLTLSTVLDVLNQLNATYFMMGGTLLGSYRHHGRIPWDDDIDLIINSSHKELVWKTLTSLKPDYGLFLSGYLDSPYHWKVYPRRHGRSVPLKPFRWPFVDLLFFVENLTHVCNESPWFPDECWPISFIFPLRLRPFENFQIPAPCDPERFVAINYDIKVCASRRWTHIYDVPMPWRSIAVPCSTLAHSHPMVVRHSTGANFGPYHKVAESLMIGNRTLHTIILDGNC